MGFKKVSEGDFDCCDSPIAFILDNGKGQFVVQLEVMLKCLRFAAEQGKIPAIPEDWWTAVISSCDSGIINA
jgi:hypothetical protein